LGIIAINKFKNIAIRLLPFAVLVIVIWKADFKAVINLLSSVKITTVIIGYLFLEVGILFRALRWKILAYEQNIIYSFRKAWPLFRIGWFTGVFLPQGLGSMAKIVYMQADGHPSAPSTASCVLERALDLVSLFIYGIVGICYLTYIGIDKTNSSGTYKALVFIVCLFAILFFLALYFSKSKTTSRIRQKIKKAGQKQKIFQWLVKLWKAMTNIHPLHLLGLTFMTLVIWLIHALSAYVLLKALHIQISFILSMAIFAAAGLSVAIPISIDGVGLREGATFLLFNQLGLNGNAAITWALLISTTSLFSRLLGAPLLLAKPIPWKKAKIATKMNPL